MGRCSLRALHILSQDAHRSRSHTAVSCCAACSASRRDRCCSRKKDASCWAARRPLTTPCSEVETLKYGLAGNMPSFPQPRLVEPTPASTRVVLPQAPARASRAPQVPKRQASRLIEFPLLQHSSLQSRSKATRTFRQAEFIELLSLYSNTHRCPSEAYNIFGCSCHYHSTTKPWTLWTSARDFSRDRFGTNVTHTDNGTVFDPSSSHSRRPTTYKGQHRPQSHYPQPDVLSPFANHPAAPFDIERQTGCSQPQDIDPCVHGMWCWPRTVAMGEGTSTGPGQDRAHEGRSGHLLATGDFG